MVYLSVLQINHIHNRALEKFGGAYGVRDQGALESAAARPQMTFAGKDLYDDIWTKAAVLGHSLCKNHPFIDGNKRTAYASMDIFLRLNGHRIDADDDRAEELVMSLIEGMIDERGLAAWLEEHAGALQ
jgi:death on curing protein